MEEVKLSPEAIVKDLCKLSNEIWKIEKKIKKCEGKLNEDENKAFSFLIDKVNGIIGNYNIKTVDYTNEKWIEGMNMLDIIGAEEKDGIEYNIVGETICPVIELNGEIVQRSKVVIYKPKAKEPKHTANTLLNKENIILFGIVVILLACLIGLIIHKIKLTKSNPEVIDTNINDTEINEIVEPIMEPVIEPIIEPTVEETIQSPNEIFVNPNTYNHELLNCEDDSLQNILLHKKFCEWTN